MARLIPKVVIDDIECKPERDVTRCLVEQLPDDCLVYHSYPWLKLERHEYGVNSVLKEGEADFVIVHPRFGFLIFEVKGGEIGYDHEEGLWYRYHDHKPRTQIKNPFTQASDSTHYIQKMLKEHAFPSEQHLPLTFGYAVIFPDCEYSGMTPPGSDPKIVLDCNDLDYLDRRIADIFRCWCRFANPRPLTQEHLDAIISVLSPIFNLVPVLFRKLEEQEMMLFRMTEEQTRVLDFLHHHHNVAIEGVAGSGKTMLAKALVQRFADRGLNTLLVCFNKSLAEWLESTMPEKYDDTVTIRHFHRLCHEFCRDAENPLVIPPPPTGDFWQKEAPLFLMEAKDVLERRFDAIVIDEGQDFYADWLDALQSLLHDPEKSPFYFFYDPAQNLYLEENFSHYFDKPMFLPTNCRNTQKIAQLCSNIKGYQIPVRATAPQGDAVLVKQSSFGETQLHDCRKILDQWINKGKLKPSQIAIICPHSRKNSSAANMRKIGQHHLTSSLSSWREDKAILFSTIRSFKGLEADAVIIIDLITPDSIPQFKVNDFYVACSRAKHMLALLVLEEEQVCRIKTLMEKNVLS